MTVSFTMKQLLIKARRGKGRLICSFACLLLLAIFEQASAGTGPQSMGTTGEQESCQWSFHSYEPSQWEIEWRDGQESGVRLNNDCEVLAQPGEVARSVQLIAAISGLMLEGRVPPAESIGLFSRMVYARRCGPEHKDTGQRRVQLIEPLVGLLRDPLTICPKPQGVDDELYEAFFPGENALQSKRHVLVGPAAPWTDTPEDPASWRVGGFDPGAVDAADPPDHRARLYILMDIGAGLYGKWREGLGSFGTLWFVDRFKRLGRAFDWIISFEIKSYSPDKIYGDVPDDILPHYIYYNQGVEKDPDGRWNPWRILRGMGAAPGDYVAVKIDIDTPSIENALVDQLLKDQKLLMLVDELFYEHHVDVKDMRSKWGGNKDALLTLNDSYRLFTALRSKGVRMHGWP